MELYALSMDDKILTCWPHVYTSFDKACDAAEEEISNWYMTRFAPLTKEQRVQKKKELEESEYQITEYYSEVNEYERLHMCIVRVKID